MERRMRGGGSDSRGRRGCEKSGDGQDKEHEEDLGGMRLLVAAPPSGRKRLSGARPFVGRSCSPPAPSGCVQREESPKRDGRSNGSRYVPQARSCGNASVRGEEDGSNNCGRPPFRSAAAEEGKEQMGNDVGENDVSYRARGNGRLRLGSNEESVRTVVAENFVDNVFDDVSSTTSLSRMSLK